MKVNTADAIWFFLASTSAIITVNHFAKQSDWVSVFPTLSILLLISLAAGWLCLLSIPSAAKLLLAAGLAERDCHRISSPLVPEATGVVVGFSYVIALTLFVPFLFGGWEGKEKKIGFSIHQLEELSMFLAALLSVNSMCFLGFVDNVLNLRWRHKLTLPTVASLPVLLVYFSQRGSTYVLVPDFLHKLMAPSESEEFLAIDFGIFYYVFLSMLSVFGTNAINILAGINGLEVGQSVILTLAMIANVLVQMNRHPWDHWQFNNETIFTLYLLLPFLSCSIALWVFNKYPSRVFVGDTYCYLAGTVLAVAGILGHCSKTLLLFMVPQVANFLYSLPQLARLIPCPRHRMPVYLPESDQVGMSFTDWMAVESISPPVLLLLDRFKIVRIEKKGDKIRFMNMTLINYTLWKLGKPVNEGRLVNVILFWQCAWILVAFGLRYRAASLFYSIVD